MTHENIAVTADRIAALAAHFPGDPIVLVLAIDGHGVRSEAFKLPTERLASVNFLPRWTRQNYRTAIARALANGLIERDGIETLGRSGASYRLPEENRLVANPAPSQRRAV